MQATTSPKVRAELVTGHRLARWILPLGFGGLAVVAALWLVLPRDLGVSVFYAAQAVFAVAYLALLGVATSRHRRTAELHGDPAGLFEGSTLLVPRASIDQVLSWRNKGVTTIELRGRGAIVIELRSVADAAALLASLDPGHNAAPFSLLATTTPQWLAILTWMGIPAVLSFPIQALFDTRISRDAIIAVVAMSAAVWLFASWWFMRRRRVSVTPTAIWMPRLFGGEREIPRSQLLEVKTIDVVTLELRFSGRRSQRIKIYDPSLLASFVERLR